MEYILLIIGFVLLIKGADFFVDGASSVAAKLKVPSLIIGLTVVSIGTSLPEAAVSISASLGGVNGISLGNVIGSNIFNLLMVVGISSIILPILTDRAILTRDMPFNLGITVDLCFMLLDSHLSRVEAVLLLLLLAVYLFILVYEYDVYSNRCGCPHRRRTPGGAPCNDPCGFFGYERYPDRTDGGRPGYFSAGVGDIHCGGPQGRFRHCHGQCDRFLYFQHPVHPGCGRCDQSHDCRLCIPD